MGEIENLPVRVIVEPASMMKYLSTFHHGVEEVALIAHHQNINGGGNSGGGGNDGAPTVELKSYIDPNKSQLDDSLHAMISIYNTLPFASYSNSLDSIVEIIFNIKDFKAMLTLSETIGTNIELSFIKPSQPLVVVSHILDGYEGQVKARLVVSTIDNPYSAAYQEQQQGAAIGNNAGGAAPTAARRQQQQQPPREELQLEEDYGKYFILLVTCIARSIKKRQAKRGELIRIYFSLLLLVFSPGYGVGNDDEDDDGIANTPPEDMDVAPSAFPGLISAPSRF
jgi:Rad9